MEVLNDRCIISLICNLDRAAEVMAIAFKVMETMVMSVYKLFNFIDVHVQLVFGLIGHIYTTFTQETVSVYR